MGDRSLTQISRAIVRCRRCPELREYCAEVGRIKRKAYADWTYWGRPVPGFGDSNARVLIAGLAPAAHGANRTGRMFTGDRSGDFLYAALHRAGLANRPEATDREDGLTLRDVFITASLRCAPPGNKPTVGQLEKCSSYLFEEMRALKPRVVIALGGIGWNAALRMLKASGHAWPSPKPKFTHGGEVVIGDVHLLGCYHVSQQNTFTGRLTEPMIDKVLERAMALAGS